VDLLGRRVADAEADGVALRDLEPNKTATVSFKANIEGIFEIELEQSGRELAKLTVEPD
jgi:hypothetical protein